MILESHRITNLSVTAGYHLVTRTSSSSYWLVTGD